MDLKCPGRMASSPKSSAVVACPSCGREVELFDDEPRVRCRCGQFVYRQALPSCVQWCASASLCLGEAGPMESMKPPEKQTNYQQAYERAFHAVRRRSRDDLIALGAREVGTVRYELPVLDQVFLIDVGAGTVALSDGLGRAASAPLRIEWQILALRYLSAPAPRMDFGKWVSFAELPGAKVYDPVYRGRVLGRLVATAGRDRETFVEACQRLGAERFEGGDEGFRFQVFPRLPVAILWFAGDDELKPGVSFPYPDNILSFFSVEDVVVLSESLARRLG
ncbi:MAG: DUF3786 domain-containing protein [Candidatus Sumerlaeota bacterium]|nr:DUF3786 domain-containing protein [Candidatus Sumerlaeota bacterium]